MPLAPRVPARLLLAAFAVAVVVLTPQHAFAQELAVAEGPIAIRDAGAGARSVACGELFVEARDALDNHLIARTRPDLAEDGTCRYAISVPAQSAVWLRLRPALVAAERATAPFVPSPPADHRMSARSVQIRWTVIAPTTTFFTPGERKTIPLTY
ncbi:MAG TPA: hypothetical protein VHS78_10220 [Candidatus Elarobacter sp.]|jgi:hypothetical protein|nr:hypothetical protein [Candidatus Elarobacter sp.]